MWRKNQSRGIPQFRGILNQTEGFPDRFRCGPGYQDISIGDLAYGPKQFSFLILTQKRRFTR
jgi:hypothetical protein